MVQLALPVFKRVTPAASLSGSSSDERCSARYTSVADTSAPVKEMVKFLKGTYLIRIKLTIADINSFGHTRFFSSGVNDIHLL